MTTSTQQKSYQIPEGEKASPVMVYTDDNLILGDVLTKEIIRVSTWLRTPAIPQYIRLLDALVVRFGGSAPKQYAMKEIYVPSSQVIAFHLKPPAQDPLDYDPKEPMRKMEPVSVLVGWFKFDGFLRMSTVSDLSKYLEVSKEVFTAIYDVEISQPASPGSGTVRTPFALLRSDRVIFASR